MVIDITEEMDLNKGDFLQLAMILWLADCQVATALAYILS